MSRKKDIAKNDLYTSVKALIEEQSPHIHLNQQKLFTLFSIAFQFMLFRSTKDPGAYIIRVEDSLLVDKLVKKSKDESTRKFMQRLVLPRKLKYQNSVFYLDFFHPGSWSITKNIPPEKIKGAIVVKNTTAAPMSSFYGEAEDEDERNMLADLPKDYFLTSLASVAQKTIAIAFEHEFDDLKVMSFDFIKSNEETISGVKISGDVDLSGAD